MPNVFKAGDSEGSHRPVGSKRFTIAISGEPGSGKTTYAKRIAEELGLRYVSIGGLFRSLAKERGLSLIDFHRLAEEDPSFDLLVDERAFSEALKGGVVVDGHLAGWLLRRVADVKIFFTAPIEVRAERVASRDGVSYEEALRQIKEREESNRRRYREIYGIDISDLSVFDLVINTALWSKEVVAETVIKLLKQALGLESTSL
ncbi:MAG: cytidylate kinase [Thermoprotei archaeon]|nr:MAG: cytidylate kinase [Thermoprotei archaeon]